MNVRSPTLADLRDTVPAAWKGGVVFRRDIKPEEGISDDWLASFWEFVSSHHSKVPEELSSILAVPLTGGRIESAEYCCQQVVLSNARLERFGEDAARSLSAAGCLCIVNEKADIVCESKSDDRITGALAAAAARQGVQLRLLVSEQKLGDYFKGICKVLAI